MPDDRRRVYWDSNVLLSYVGGLEDRLPTIAELFRRSRAGEVELVTSIQPVEPPPLPEKIEVDDLGVVCWMAVLPPG